MQRMMPVAIEVPGLDAFVQEVPDGRVVLLEGDISPAKSHLARSIGRTAARQKRPVTLLSTRSGEAVDGISVQDVAAWPAKGHPANKDLIVDSFSLLAMEDEPSVVADRVRSIRRDCQKNGRIAILVLDDEQLALGARAVCHHLADGIIQFQSREDADGPVPFLRIPKWMDRLGADRNLYYGFDGNQIMIDTRRRVN